VAVDVAVLTPRPQKQHAMRAAAGRERDVLPTSSRADLRSLGEANRRSGSERPEARRNRPRTSDEIRASLTDMPEWESDSTPPRGGFLDRASHAAAFFGGSLMLAAGMLIVASIATRWFLAASIPGDVELIQAATAVAAFAFLPFGQLNRSNIVVDTFTQRLPERVCTAIDAFWDI